MDEIGESSTVRWFSPSEVLMAAYRNHQFANNTPTFDEEEQPDDDMNVADAFNYKLIKNKIGYVREEGFTGNNAPTSEEEDGYSEEEPENHQDHGIMDSIVKNEPPDYHDNINAEPDLSDDDIEVNNASDHKSINIEARYFKEEGIGSLFEENMDASEGMPDFPRTAATSTITSTNAKNKDIAKKNQKSTRKEMSVKKMTISGPPNKRKSQKPRKSVDAVKEASTDPTVKRPNICPVCNKAFARPSELQRHSTVHSGEKPFSCPHCPMSYKQKVQLTSHLEVHNPNSVVNKKTELCPICDKYVRRLETHIATHISVDNPSSCETCGAVFTNPKKFLLHQQTHNESPETTCVICGKHFLCPADLRNHMITHTREKTHLCDLCGKGFIRPSLLVRHKISHSGLKPHTCDVCGKSFNLKTHLKIHVQIHNEQSEHVCLICRKQFKLLDYLKGHMKRCHSQECSLEIMMNQEEQP